MRRRDGDYKRLPYEVLWRFLRAGGARGNEEGSTRPEPFVGLVAGVFSLGTFEASESDLRCERVP